MEIYNGMNELELQNYVNALCVNKTVTHKHPFAAMAPAIYRSYGDGVIVNVNLLLTAVVKESGLCADILFGNTTRSIVLPNKAITSNEIDMNEIAAISSAVRSAAESAQTAQFVANRQADEQRKIEAQKAAELEKREAAAKRAYDLAVDKATKLSAMTKLLPSDNIFVAIGWLAKHGRALRAAMPDVLDNWFVREFGDQPHVLVDSSKRTVNGFPVQWALSITLSVDTNEHMPAYLLDKLSTRDLANKPIADTEFLFGLARDYGFKFGKKQNADEIRKHIPVDCLADFELGYGM